MSELSHFQFVVLVLGGASAMIGSVAIIVGSIVKKNAIDIKRPCIEKFNDLDQAIDFVEEGAKERHDKILRMEIRFEEILNRIEKLEKVVEENIKLTNQIYLDMPKRNGNGRSPRWPKK